MLTVNLMTLNKYNKHNYQHKEKSRLKTIKIEYNKQYYKSLKMIQVQFKNMIIMKENKLILSPQKLIMWYKKYQGGCNESRKDLHNENKTFKSIETV